jgi:hypothetical protein
MVMVMVTVKGVDDHGQGKNGARFTLRLNTTFKKWLMIS